MPWRCPACELQIRHSEFEERPQLGQIYRCHICRLDLVVDDTTQKLTAAPFRDDYAEPDPRLKATS
jgi:hypothetical protein